MDYLYHYSNIEALALILKNKTFKLRSLNTLDDLQEEKSSDIQDFGKYVFVSSWTEDMDESIPMWNMYANMKSGIRIKMIKDPFIQYKVDRDYILNSFDNCVVRSLDCGGLKMGVPAIEPYGFTTSFQIENLIIPQEEFFSSEYYLYNCTPDSILQKVIYTEEASLLTPQISQISDQYSIVLSKLGYHKRRCWEFQKEYRYILRFAPFNIKKFMAYPCISINETLQKYNSSLNKLPFSNYFLYLREDAYNTMEITTSPNFSDGNLEILNLLKEKYNKNMKICKSGLSNTIRE